MKFKRKSMPNRLPKDAGRLVAFAEAATNAKSLVERKSWVEAITELADKVISTRHDTTLDAALEVSFGANPRAHELLAELVEAASESAVLTHDGQQWNALLIAIPIAAWSKYSVPVGAIKAQHLDPITVQLRAHALAQDVKCAVVPWLYSVDFVPQSFSETNDLLKRLAHSAIEGLDVKEKPPKVTDALDLLSDARFLIAAISAPLGRPLFRWQELDAAGAPTPLETCAAAWQAQAGENLARLLPGCNLDVGLPNAYFANCRWADEHLRPATVRAAVAFLETTLQKPAKDFRAVVAPVGESVIDEYRIGFTLGTQADVLHGVVWPLFGSEDEDGDDSPNAKPPIEQIREALRSANVTDLAVHQQRLAPEYCDDCGAPFFPDHEAELMHAEMPEDSDTGPAHYH